MNIKLIGFLMNQQKVSYFISMLRDLTGVDRFDNEKLVPLLEQMEIMSHLLEDYSAVKTEEDRIGIGHRISACQKESGPMMADFLKSHGTGEEETRKYFDRNFRSLSSRDQERIESMQKQFAQVNTTPVTSKIKRKKGKKI